MALLDGAIADKVFAAFKGKLHTAILLKAGIAESGGLDANGDPIDISNTQYACEGFDSRYSEFYRAQAGIPDGDLKACIFAKSLAAGIEPEKDDRVRIAIKWYQIRRVARDPATALWVCQSFPIAAPGGI
jgi:hypothetical protein